jgi:DNA-binding beta-propeller fold protein YncE
VVIRGISVAGQPVTHGQSLPALVAVVTGMLAPLRLEGAANLYASTPALSGDGTLYVPRNRCRDVLVFSADGTPLPSLPLASVGLSESACAAAFDDASATLLLANVNSDLSKLVAVDAVSRAVRWSTRLGGHCYGIAVLPAQGLVVVSAYEAKQLRVHRLADGALVATTTTADNPSFVAADPATATLYVSTGFRVSSFRWNAGALTLVSEGVVEPTGNTNSIRPLAVVPPAPGQHTSYLVVGTFYSPTLLVMSLPGRRLVHTHTLTGMKVTGLAADPSGTALAVCDRASQALHVLQWPLPGMPPLQ